MDIASPQTPASGTSNSNYASVLAQKAIQQITEPVQLPVKGYYFFTAVYLHCFKSQSNFESMSKTVLLTSTSGPNSFGITPWERTAGFASLFLIDIDTIYMVL